MTQGTGLVLERRFPVPGTMTAGLSGGSRIFPGGAPTPKSAIIFQFFAENCMKMKEFGPPGGRVPGSPPLDPPMGLVVILMVTSCPSQLTETQQLVLL